MEGREEEEEDGCWDVLIKKATKIFTKSPKLVRKSDVSAFEQLPRWLIWKKKR
jgi:hypothetical protein